MHAYVKKPLKLHARLLERDMFVQTLEGVMKGSAGKHYYVEGIHGEPYIVERKIFEESHEIADDVQSR